PPLEPQPATAAAPPAPGPAVPVVLTAAAASAAPVREPGLRSRAGNAMSRTRQALLAGAADTVVASGTKITMAQVAIAAGVAKATLYNHFRTREAVLDGLLDAEVRALVDELRPLPLAEALVAAARALGEHPVLVALREREPQTVAAVATLRGDGAWTLARGALAERGVAEGDVVLRWLASFVLAPASPDQIRSDVAFLTNVLSPAPVVSAAAG
ncbi:MAG: TetR/AcrR family transcriptional regulator, partial [Jatrophihabitans sp.]|uniref:TetR/AcrR family transcriptional regulator n=1 Tax=Jatrophihabitans sp. TaxID=1932789 RepID=UPI003F7EE037